MKLLILLLISIMPYGDNPCKGKTKAGVACSRNAKEGTLYCFQHDPKAHRCGAPTKDGGACKMVTKSGLCHHHKK